MNTFSSKVFAGKRFAVAGLGRAGLAALRALTAMGATVVAWDDAPFAREAAAREGFVVQDPAADIGDFDALILSPGIAHVLPVPHRIAAAARAARRPIWTDAELLYRAVRGSSSAARFVGITGTNGKSTTTALLAHILSSAGIPNAAGANLGPAALSLPLLPDTGVYVLEMSSYMLERLETLRFDAACLLNLSPDHLDRHGDMAGYLAAKRQVFARQQARDVAVVGIDDAYGASVADSLPQAIRISGRHPADVWCEFGLLQDRIGVIVDLAAAHALPGEHNAQNAAAAAALAGALGVARQDVADAIISFPGLAHRQELVATVDGIRFINDSKATNADATGRALACYKRVVWIAGGIAKAGGIAELDGLLGRVGEALLIGRDAPLFAETLKSQGISYRVMDGLEQAVPAALSAAKAIGVDTVLLSPACASFDQFSGFESRGTRFAELARALGGHS